MLFLPILLTDVPAYLSRKSTGGLDIPVYTPKAPYTGEGGNSYNKAQITNNYKVIFF